MVGLRDPPHGGEPALDAVRSQVRFKALGDDPLHLPPGTEGVAPQPIPTGRDFPPNLGPAVDTGIFAAGEIGAQFLTLNKAARLDIKSHLGASKLRTSITATNSAGQTDTDTHVFRFRS